mmetsp:Transcript_14599/g.44588  ORF Transcript_14599/g.44588 Transcript_14599/m.44588 type:complete len:115 (-) Transcript_14599:318-662(-)
MSRSAESRKFGRGDTPWPAKVSPLRRLWLLLCCGCREACCGRSSRGGYDNVRTNVEELANLRGEMSTEATEIEISGNETEVHEDEALRTSDEFNHIALRSPASLLHKQHGAVGA